jgi:agmatine deiminase
MDIFKDQLNHNQIIKLMSEDPVKHGLDSLVPEWTIPKAIGLVWPQDLYKNDVNLLELYIHLIRLISELGTQVYIFNPYKTREPAIRSQLGSLDPKIINSDLIADIWIRDYGPIAYQNRGSRKVALKATYEPDYHRTKEEKVWGSRNNRVMTEDKSGTWPDIDSRLGNLKLDGGNFIHNGAGVAFSSNKVISYNESQYLLDIISLVKSVIGPYEYHLLPCEPGDDTGHLDGCLRFLDRDTLFVTSYPYAYIQDQGFIAEKEYKESQEFTAHLKEIVEDLGLRTINVPNGIPKQNSKRGFLSGDFENAWGNYLNYLRIGDKIIIPTFNNSTWNNEAYKVYCQALGSDNVIQGPDCTHLAELGGVLNCITTHIF